MTAVLNENTVLADQRLPRITRTARYFSGQDATGHGGSDVVLPPWIKAAAEIAVGQQLDACDWRRSGRAAQRDGINEELELAQTTQPELETGSRIIMAGSE